MAKWNEALRVEEALGARARFAGGAVLGRDRASEACCSTTPPGRDLAARLAAVPGVNITICPEDDDALLARLLPETEVLWHVLKRCTAEMIAAAPRLRLIQKIGVGVNTIDLEAAKARGIPVCNLPGTNARAVAELTLALMLAVLRRVPRFDAAMRRGEWLDAALQDGIGELGGRSVGLVGYGAIPRLLAPVLAAMGCRVIYTSRTAHADAVGEWRSLDALLAEADVVSLHLPLTAETDEPDRRGGAGADEAGRGADQHGARRAGGSGCAGRGAAVGRLAGAGLDVFVHEPHDCVRARCSVCRTVVLTPHIALADHRHVRSQLHPGGGELPAAGCRRGAAAPGDLRPARHPPRGGIRGRVSC